jgi:hypothetical protein
MSTVAAERTGAMMKPWARDGAMRHAQAALTVAIASGIPFAAIGLFATLTPNDHHFRHTADYWYTGLGIPYLAAPIVLVAAVHALHDGRDGRVGRAGTIITAVALGVIVAILPYGVAAGTSGGLGPTYPIASFAADLGMVLFCIGAFRTQLLPRTLVAAWLPAWLLGGALGPAWGAPLLVAVYAVIATTLQKRVAGLESPRV